MDYFEASYESADVCVKYFSMHSHFELRYEYYIRHTGHSKLVRNH